MCLAGIRNGERAMKSEGVCVCRNKPCGYNQQLGKLSDMAYRYKHGLHLMAVLEQQEVFAIAWGKEKHAEGVCS